MYRITSIVLFVLGILVAMECFCNKTLYGHGILMCLSRPMAGQTEPDSIVFHGKIIDDGVLYNIGFILSIKNNPTFKSAIVGIDNPEFFTRCVRGDTLVLSTMASPYGYYVEFVAQDTMPQHIHVWGFPQSGEEWYFGERYRTTRLPIKDGTSRSVLAGIYKCRKERQHLFFYDTTLKLKTDGTFEFMKLLDEGDIYGVIYHTGKWSVEQDTVVCEAIPELYPPSVQERYPGQVLHFVGGGWEEDRQKAAETGIVYKFLIRRKGLIYRDESDRDIYRKVERIGTNKMVK